MASLVVLHLYRQAQPRREALEVSAKLSKALSSNDPARTLELVMLPPSQQAAAPAKQGARLTGLLRGEIDDSGVDEMRRHAEFGPLAQLFPQEGERWSRGAGVPLDSCVALRMERAGVRAEIVFHQSPDGLRVLRCNNVSQMASPIPVSPP